MGRRSALRGIVHDVLLSFVSRTNDLNGYWALGQLRTWMEDSGADRLEIPLLGESPAPMHSAPFLMSQRFAAMLQDLMRRKNLRTNWVAAAHVTLELTTLDEMSCALCVTSDLGKAFTSGRVLLVRRHDPGRESQRGDMAPAQCIARL